MDYLVHHGILGQKWGIRRYQNLDGTLTAAGRARYGDGSDYGNVSRFSRKNAELVNRYKDRGLTPEEAEYAARRHLKVKKRLKVALTLSAVVALSMLAKGNSAAAKVVDSVADTPLSSVNEKDVERILDFDILDSAGNVIGRYA